MWCVWAALSFAQQPQVQPADRQLPGTQPPPPFPPPSFNFQYDIALFDRVRDRLDWDPERLNWTCLEWYEMLGALEAGDGTCDIAVAGIDISNKHLDAGITFSLPTLRGGYKLMVLPEQGSTNYWVFMDAFEWCVWWWCCSCLRCCAAVVPLLA